MARGGGLGVLETLNDESHQTKRTGQGNQQGDRHLQLNMSGLQFSPLQAQNIPPHRGQTPSETDSRRTLRWQGSNPAPCPTPSPIPGNNLGGKGFTSAPP